MSITTEILRIKGGKSDIKSLAQKKNIEIPTSAKIDRYAEYLGQNWPDVTIGVSYDGTKVRGSTRKWTQLFGNNPSTQSATGTRVIQDGYFYAVKNHKYFLMTSGPILVYGLIKTNDFSKGSYSTPMTNIIVEWTYDDAAVNLWIYAVGTMTSTQNYFIVDLTDYFGAGNEPTDTTSTEILEIIERLKAYPEYTTGELVYGYYKGIKLGKFDYIDTSSNILHLGGEEKEMSFFPWSVYSSSYPNLFSSNSLKGKAKPVAHNYDISTLICSTFRVCDYSHIGLSGYVDKYIAIDNTGGLHANDTGYTNADLFRQSLQGVKIYYELANPIEIDLS